MPGEPIRVLSDIHYGDRSSRVESMESLRPLTEGASALVLNGDTLDTRESALPDFTGQCRREAAAFFARLGIPSTFLTGNHDPDISGTHWLELAGGRVWAFHGDVLFDDIVPWSRDGPRIRALIRAARDETGVPPDALSLEQRMEIHRRVARDIPQRHQSERRRLRHLALLLYDTSWPPWRIPAMLGAWRTLPGRAHRFAHRHRPDARFVLVGHTHRPALWRAPDGVVVINTGSYTRPFGAWAVDIAPDRLQVRRVLRRGKNFT